MSFDNARKARMDKILDLLKNNPQGLPINVLAKETMAIAEVTRKRIEMYIDELSWCGIVEKRRDGRVRLRK